MKKLLPFLLLISSLVADEVWHLELKNGTIFTLNSRPKQTESNYSFAIEGKNIEVPAPAVISLTKKDPVKEQFLYTEAEAQKNSTPEQASKTIVRITSPLHRGTGTIIHPEGYVLTNNTNIKNDYTLKITLSDGSSFDASVAAKSDLFDLAILKIKTDQEREFPYSRFGDERSLTKKSSVYTFSTSENKTWKKVDTELANASSYFGREDGLLYQQYKIKMRPDNIGSPLFDPNGNLIGIITQKTQSVHYQNMWFSTPITFIKVVMKNLNSFVANPSHRPISYRDIESESE